MFDVHYASSLHKLFALEPYVLLINTQSRNGQLSELLIGGWHENVVFLHLVISAAIDCVQTYLVEIPSAMRAVLDLHVNARNFPFEWEQSSYSTIMGDSECRLIRISMHSHPQAGPTT